MRTTEERYHCICRRVQALHGEARRRRAAAFSALCAGCLCCMALQAWTNQNG